MTQCKPSRPQSLCKNCARKTIMVSSDPIERKRTILIDPTAVLKEGQMCSLFEPVAEPVYWWESAN